MMRVSSALFLASASLVLCSCTLLTDLMPDLKVPMPKLPKLSLPSMRTVAKLIPGMPDKDSVDANDPEVPFNTRHSIGYGHTLRLEVYEGTRSPDRIYSGITMVNSDGLLPLGETGTARVGGLHLPEAADAIAMVFRLAGRNTREIMVQIISVENTPVVYLNGDVREREFIPAFKDMTVRQAVTVTGGRKPGSTNRGVYISRRGQRHFFTSLESADRKWEPQAGDIITLSTDI
ncbi:polysaccharide biosynthesis/export family protein [Prosthecobacter vanneervenii]|uniref:Soluble ligand binding domain-containing protein n=1 Tax=Prosthecobacter vanneervenii TaxID=48466 RepID=A0A7W7Y9L2_9BACT|nr:hypothetical protein [Prosthecobacter vanneervenii]MBB5031962.1 hypothetical protein [Prosthecobacter vanneervenii]